MQHVNILQKAPVHIPALFSCCILQMPRHQYLIRYFSIHLYFLNFYMMYLFIYIFFCFMSPPNLSVHHRHRHSGLSIRLWRSVELPTWSVYYTYLGLITSKWTIYGRFATQCFATLTICFQHIYSIEYIWGQRLSCITFCVGGTITIQFYSWLHNAVQKWCSSVLYHFYTALSYQRLW